MNEMTPPKLTPLAQSRHASGILPTEQTNERTAMIGPTAAFSISRRKVVPVSIKSAFHQSDGTSTAKNPAIKNPAASSFQSMSQSIQKAFARRDHLLFES